MAGLANDLTKLLNENDVGLRVQDYLLRVGCLTAKNVVNRCGTASELMGNCIEGAINNPDGTQEINEERLTEKVKMKQVWLESQARVDKALDAVRRGIDPEDLDTPLDEDTHKAVVKAHRDHYDWTLPAKAMVSDALLGRFRRQFEKSTVTVLPVAKVVSLAHSHKGQEAKRRKVAHNVPLEYVEGAEDLACSDTRSWLLKLKIMTNGWAIAGTYQVTFQSDQVYNCHWQDADYYFSTFESRAWGWVEAFSDGPVMEALTELEERFRVAAIEITRTELKDNSFVPWGRALLASLKDHYEWFADTRMDLREKFARTARSGRGQPERELVRKAPRGKGDKRHETPTVGKDNTRPKIATTFKGQPLCKGYNDRRGCANSKGGKCKKGVHGCDILMASGDACGNTTHKRQDHREAVHGKWMQR